MKQALMNRARRSRQDGGILAAAALHDTVEDTNTSFEEIEQIFGRAIAGIVREVTDDKTLKKAKRKRLQFGAANALVACVSTRVFRLGEASGGCAQGFVPAARAAFRC